MSNFIEPKGICFDFEDEMPAAALSAAICKIVSFLQSIDPYNKLHKYEDWWEHDGLHCQCGQVDFDGVFGMVNSPRNLLESTPGDDFVFVGIAPIDNSWYLRYRVQWDDNESSLVGRCAVVLPETLAEKFRTEVLTELEAQPTEVDSERYYQETVL